MDAASTYRLSAIVRIDMRAVVQRVSRAAVRVEERIVGEIGAGLLVLLGVAAGDTDAEADALAGKVARLRIFPDDGGRFDRSVVDAGGGVLVVSSSRCSRTRRRETARASLERQRRRTPSASTSGSAQSSLSRRPSSAASSER